MSISEPHSEPQGFLALPESGSGPGVLVLHAWWGLNDTIRELCQRLAGEGFVAFAPDLYGGDIATTIEEAESRSGALDGEQAKADVAQAVAFLSQRAEPSAPLGVIGFSLGGYFAVDVSCAEPEQIGPVVLFYGVGEGDFPHSKATYLGHFAENDPYETPESIAWLEGELGKVKRPYTFHHYAGTGHWFFEADRTDAYNPAAAQLAWERTLAFLRKHLVV